MIFKQFYLNCLAHASYLIGDENDEDSGCRRSKARRAGQLDQIPRNRPVVVFCAGGYRSSIAASLLQRAGFSRLSELTGGMAAWDLRTSVSARS